MSHSIRFARPCPHCGLMLELSLGSIGSEVYCHHCGRIFLADASSESADAERWMDEKIDRLLDAAERHVARFSMSSARFDYHQEV